MTAGANQLDAILDGLAECFYALDRDWRITVFNRGAEAFFGLSRADILGRVVWDALRVRDVPALETVYRRAMAGEPSEVMSLPSPARPGRWIEGRAFPLPDGLGVAFRDITEQREAYEALRRREAELARVQRIAGVGGVEVDLRHGFDNRRSPEYLLLHGLPPEAARESHADWVERIHPDDRERTEKHFRDSVRGTATSYASEYRIVRPSDRQERWILASAEIERDERGRALRLVGAHRDITDRKRAEARRELLIHELNHRVKNTLATVQAIASQSWRQAGGSGDAAWAAFESRLLALSRAHDVLTREDWEGADLSEIVAGAIAPYRRESGDRFTVSGERIRLDPQTALALARALGELATNAVKYGALSREGGQVALAWSVAPPPGGDRHACGDTRLRLDWRESGGPEVAPPSRRGFGTRLIERSLAHDLEGTVDLDYAANGLVCRIDARLKPVAPASARPD